MSYGPQSHAEAKRLAEQSQNDRKAQDLRNWDHIAKQNYYANGGK